MIRKCVSAAACFMLLTSAYVHVDAAGNTSSGTTDVHYDGIIVIVNGDIITAKDFEDQVKIVLMSSGIKDSPEVREEILQDMINNKVKWQCTKKFAPPQGWVTNKEVDETCKGNNSRLVRDNIRTALAWRNYIQAKYGKHANVTDREARSQMRNILNKRNQESFVVSRILFPIFSKSDIKRVESRVQNIQKMLAQGTSFESLARQFGEGAESKNNGSLGWVYEGQISAAEYNALKSMKLREVRTVKTNKGIYILRLDDKKEAGLNALHYVTIVQIALPQPKYAGGQDTRSVLDGLLNYFRTPASLIKQAKVIGCYVSEPSTGLLENMNPEIRESIKSARNGISRVMSNERAIYVFCVLKQKTEKIPVPSLEQIKMNLIYDKLESCANKELRLLIDQAHIQKEEGYYTYVRR